VNQRHDVLHVVFHLSHFLPDDFSLAPPPRRSRPPPVCSFCC
jgi:hypothetical protein